MTPTDSTARPAQPASADLVRPNGVHEKASPEHQAPSVVVTDLVKSYSEKPAVDGIAFEIQYGEIFALLGPNGAGKTTTIRSILGLSPAKRGQIRFDGKVITGLPTHKISRLGIGWVPDDRRVFPTLTGKRNLALGTRTTRFRKWTQDGVVEVFPALDHLVGRECENMSGGELQMVSISRALLGSPGLILFDEPSQGLAPKIVQDVLKTIRKLKAEGVACLVVEQNALAALEVADRAYVMELGEFVLSGTAEEVAANPRVAASYLGI
jgi:branched-chain amino acid transport system ATP-binding protein